MSIQAEAFFPSSRTPAAQSATPLPTTSQMGSTHTHTHKHMRKRRARLRGQCTHTHTLDFIPELKVHRWRPPSFLPSPTRPSRWICPSVCSSHGHCHRCCCCMSVNIYRVQTIGQCVASFAPGCAARLAAAPSLCVCVCESERNSMM